MHPCKNWFIMGKIPMQEKSAQQGQKNNPINCSGSWLVQKNPRLNLRGIHIIRFMSGSTTIEAPPQSANHKRQL
jgi:hypothetical protein